MYENKSFEVSAKLIRNVVLIAVVIAVISIIGKASAARANPSGQVDSGYAVEAR